MPELDDQDYIIIERKRGGVGAFLWGAAIGAGLALLLAPRSGRQLRAHLRDGVQRLRDQAEDAVREAQRSVTDRYDSVRTDVRDRVEAAREAFEAGRRAARQAHSGPTEPDGPDTPPLDRVADEELDTGM
ncbi:MAG: YtxH domain-containing protein [Gemmatimonadetes bacterium]|nr:YtxH domain-containing protein [Gemmatimonadota bacterium]